MGVVSSFYLNLYWKNKAAKIDGEALNARLSRKKTRSLVSFTCYLTLLMQAVFPCIKSLCNAGCVSCHSIRF